MNNNTTSTPSTNPDQERGILLLANVTNTTTTTTPSTDSDQQHRSVLANVMNNNTAATQATDNSPQQSIIPEWDGCTQDAIIK
jgi:hypothetical protein